MWPSSWRCAFVFVRIRLYLIRTKRSDFWHWWDDECLWRWIHRTLSCTPTWIAPISLANLIKICKRNYASNWRKNLFSLWQHHVYPVLKIENKSRSVKPHTITHSGGQVYLAYRISPAIFTQIRPMTVEFGLHMTYHFYFTFSFRQKFHRFRLQSL